MRGPLLLTLLSTSVSALAANLDIDVTGIRSAEGEVRLMLFDNAKGFRKETASREVLSLPATPGKARAIFKDLPTGRYAVIVYHDENANRKLDLRFGMIPVEGYGLSNNPETLGPPSFEQAALQIDGDTSIVIKLNY